MERDYENFVYASGGIHHDLKFEVENPISRQQSYLLDTPEPVALWKAMTVASAEGRFKIINVGYNRLAKTQEAVKRIFLNEWRKTKFQRNIQIKLSEDTLFANQLLVQTRWAIHDKVLEKYRIMKEYFSETELADLALFNGMSTASDVLAVVSDSGKTIAEMGKAEFKDNVLLTIQVSYPQDQMGIMPIPQAGEKLVSYQFLPLTLRIHPEKRKEVLAEMHTYFENKKLVEFARYVRFEKIPTSVHSRLLLEAVKHVEKNNGEIIIASTDHITMRLFTEKYGFKVFKQIPSRSEEPEFLIYLAVGSPEYKNFRSNLENASNELTEREDAF